MKVSVDGVDYVAVTSKRINVDGVEYAEVVKGESGITEIVAGNGVTWHSSSTYPATWYTRSDDEGNLSLYDIRRLYGIQSES